MAQIPLWNRSQTGICLGYPPPRAPGSRLTRELARKVSPAMYTPLHPAPKSFDGRVCLLMHGDEQTTMGGPHVRLPRTARALCDLGIPARAMAFQPGAEIPEEVVHLFNVWPPRSALQALYTLKAAGKRVVFSPIYLDFSERPFWQFDLPGLALDDSAAVATQTRAARAYLRGRGRLHEPVPGYHAMVREMLALADHVIFLSASERAALAGIGANVDESRASLIANPVDLDAFAPGDPTLFRAAHLDGLSGPRDYVICVARIEERKNQLMLARAMLDLPLRLVLVGHVGSPAYADRLRSAAGPHLVMTGRMEPGGEMLRSALTGAQAFVLPSWAEGMPLSALEAAATGTPLVLGDRGAEQTTFGDLADYCDPGNPNSIAEGIRAAQARRADPAHAEALRALLRDRHGWTCHARDTCNAYARAVTAAPRLDPVPQGPAAVAQAGLALDITPAAQTPRGDQACAFLLDTLRARDSDMPVICWSTALARFVQVPARFDTLEQALSYIATLGPAQNAPPVCLPQGYTLVSLGGAWRQDPIYLAGLEDLKQHTGCALLALIHDLGPLRAPIWYPATEIADFHACFERLSALVDGVVATSQSCAKDLAAAQAGRARTLPVMLLRLGDPAPVAGPAHLGPVQQKMEGCRFVLAAGDLEMRSNYGLLHRIWARFADSAELEDLHLVIATPHERGLAGQRLAEEIARDHRVRDRIHLMTGLAADDISWLYDKSLFTLHPAQDTGWALPVTESLAHRKPCLAARSGALPEIVPRLVELLDPEDFIEWSVRIKTLACDPAAISTQAKAIAESFTPQPWADTAEALVRLAAAPRPVHRAHEIYAGEIIRADIAAAPLSIRFDTSWHRADATGRWAKYATAGLALNAGRLRRAGQGCLMVVLELRAHLPDGRERQFRVCCAEQTLFEAPVNAESFPDQLLLSVPMDLLDEEDMLRLGLHMPVTPVEEAPDPARAACGIGLISARLLDPDLSNPLLTLSTPEVWSTGKTPLVADLLDTDHRAVIAPGLSGSPAWGVGGACGAFVLLVPVIPGAGPQTLTLVLRPIATARSPVRARIFWNGRMLADRIWQDDMPDTLSLHLDTDDLAHCGPAVLSIESNSVCTPHDLGLGQTTALAGLGLTDLMLTPKAAGS